MNKEFFLILFSVFLFVAVNTIFYFQILNKQLDFQTELLTSQTQICGNTIEQEGQRFENELNSIPYQNDFTRLFTDEEIKQSGSVNLQKLYTGYSQLIDKITVYDNFNNVYSIILDNKNNFVSDYYESQRQVPLQERDQLLENDGKFKLTIPGFDDKGVVRSNILVDLNHERFVAAVFERYALEHTVWQWMISEDGELISSAENVLIIPDADLKQIGEKILEVEEGSLFHTITIDSISTRVVSVYHPVRLVNRDMGIVFSIKTDLFLQSIIMKIVIISVCSLLLLVILLYIHFRATNVQTKKIKAHKYSEDSLFNTIESLPFGIIFLNPDGGISSMNHASRAMLLEEDEDIVSYSELGLDNIPGSVNGLIYQRTFGDGILLMVRRKSGIRHIYKMEWEAVVGDDDSRIVLLIDVSELNSLRNLEKISELARVEMLDKMAKEISVPLAQLRKIIPEGRDEDLQKSFTLLSNLISATLDFASKEAAGVVTEEIPFYLRSELELALEPYHGNHSSVSIITKVRNEVPDKLVGDPFRLRQAINSLVDNALELTDEGRILISCEVLEQRAGPLKLEFHVEDTGSGMNEEQIETLMNDLNRGKINLNEESSGLKKRLAIARQHIELMKGQLWLESPSTISTSPDHPGIKYSFTLDIFTAESVRENLVFNEIGRFEDIECLVVSQEKETETDRFKFLLDTGLKLKYLIYREENTDSLFELIAEKSASIQMLILMNSATQDGFSIAGQIIRKELNDNLVVILLNSEHRQDHYSISMGAGIDYYLEDPFDPYLFAKIFSKHYPGLDKGELDKIPRTENINSRISVLLAEDNLFNRKLIQGLFKRLGLDIDLAENGAQAVQRVRDKHFDIIFMDLLMPEMDGVQAAIEIRKHGFKAPIIALTAVENEDALKSAMKAGFDDYLIKPAAEDSIRKILLKIIPKS
jgi:CheY-like chemotaxis protein/signal transduction histidine kinase